MGAREAPIYLLFIYSGLRVAENYTDRIRILMQMNHISAVLLLLLWFYNV